MNKNISDKHKCLDCDKLIDYRNLHCQKCWGKSIRKELPNCIDCGKKVSKYNVKRCGKCYHLWNRGKNHPCHGKIGKLNLNFGKKHPGMNKGKKNGMYGRPTPHGKHIKYRNTWFRSSYEIAYAKYLDRNRIKWEYESKIFNLGQMCYIPE